jgi:hypothetical protein
VSRLGDIGRRAGFAARRDKAAKPAAVQPAATAAATAKPASAAKPKAADKAAQPIEVDDSAELIGQRDRLLEKFTVMQADLGGAFYEMAIRDHVRLDVLTRKAAELQRVDAELLAVERVLELQRNDAAGLCPSCGAPYAAGVRFCAQCGNPLVPVATPTAPAPGPVHPTPPIPESSPLPQLEGVVPPAVEPQSHLMRPPGQASEAPPSAEAQAEAAPVPPPAGPYTPPAPPASAAPPVPPIPDSEQPTEVHR